LSLRHRITPDVSALRSSRDYRLVAIGALVSGIGTQMALVAVPFQVYAATHSAALVGLVGAAELGPTVFVALLGGAIADRVDRRRLLLLAQAATALAAGALSANAFLGGAPTWSVFVLAALLAGASALDQLSRTAMIATLAGEWIRSAIAFNYGMGQLTAIVGPSLGGIVIAAGGVGWAYGVDAVSVLGTAVAAIVIAPQRPRVGATVEPILGSIFGGLRFVRSSNALLGSFVIDLFAMTFGMPRALFVVLSLRVFHAGASGAGLLYASVALGAALAAFATGWIAHTRRIGRLTIAMVLIWGLAIAAAGTVSSLVMAAALLAVAGAADSVSAVCRGTIMALVTPEHLRGRMSAVHGLVVTGGVRLGDVESGTVASLSSPRFAVVSGGLACVASLALVLLAFPGLRRFDAREHALPTTT
jgi:MFS family permease